MAKINLKSKTREVTGKAVKRFRKEGLIPAVVYGNKIAPQNLWVDFSVFSKAYEAAGESTIIELNLGDKEKINALIHDVQVDPITGKFSHIDFFQIRMDEKIEADIPLEFIGESPAVKELAGILVKNMDEIPVSCLPADLPSKIEADISKIATFNDHLKVEDLDISEKVKVLVDSDAIVALVIPPRSEDELSKLDEKVEEDVTKVEGVASETDETEEENKEGIKEEKK